MINKIQIQNFKNIRDQTIDLERLTLVVGANAAGKTSLLEAIHMAVRAITGAPDKVFGYERHCDWLYTRGGSGPLRLRCFTSGGEFSVSATAPGTFPPASHETLGRGRWTFETEPTEWTEQQATIKHAKSLVFLHLNAAKLAKASYTDRRPPRVEFDGENLASVLSYLLLTDRDKFEELEKRMRDFVPLLKRIRIRKETVRKTETELVRFGDDTIQRKKAQKFEGDALLFDFDNAKDVPAHGLSEGTLMLLGLLTVLFGPSQPEILLMDDIEHGLHPSAQRELLRVLISVVDENPTLQIIASAHSPFMLDTVEGSQVKMVTLDHEGYSVFGTMSDHPDFDRWKNEMTPGDYWTTIGEKWITDGPGQTEDASDIGVELER